MGNRDAADDLVQDTLERAMLKFHLWRPGKLRAWLFSIMHNVFVNQLKARRVSPSAELDENFPGATTRSGSPTCATLSGRLLPGPEGPVAQFMYQEPAGKRLTLYISSRATSEEQTAFRFVQQGKVSVFYWIDGNCGYALSGEMDKADLSRVSSSVYRQLNP